MISLKKSAIAAAVGVSSLCFLGAAHATVLTPSGGSFAILGASPPTYDFSGYQSGSGATLADGISFSVSSALDTDVLSGASHLSANGYASFATYLYQGGTLLATGANSESVHGSWTSEFFFSGLSAGPVYTIHVDGTTLSGAPSGIGANGYTGGMTLSATPVPEPETYAMMLAGLGLMGFIARRRKQNAAA